MVVFVAVEFAVLVKSQGMFLVYNINTSNLAVTGSFLTFHLTSTFVNNSKLTQICAPCASTFG